MRGMSYKKSSVIVAFFCILLASPFIFIYASMIWASSCSAVYAYDFERSLGQDMSLESAKRQLRVHGYEIYELGPEKCNEDGNLSYPNFRSEGGPCIFANTEIDDFVCNGNRVHARLFFNLQNDLVSWKTLDANSYL